MQDRYARHHLLEGWDQPRLANAHILVAGVGAVGNEVVKLLALMGVGHLLLVDFDTIEISNLTRSVLFRETDIGQSKARVAAQRARDLNPDIEVQAVQGNLEFDVGLGVYRAQDVVIGCLDSINARLALNRACCRTGVPWINTGIEATVAEIALFEGRENQTGACFECAMSETMWARRNQRFSCGGLRSELPEDVVPTTATVASLTAAYAVNEALLLLHGRKEKGEGDASAFSFLPSAFGLAFSQKLYLSVTPYSMQTVELPRRPDCLAHETWEPVTLQPQRAEEITFTQLLSEAGMPEGVVELGFDLLTTMRCLNCERQEEIGKPLETCSLALNHCPHCGTPSRQPETVSWLDAHSAYADQPLSKFGIPNHQILALKDDNGRRYMQISGGVNFEQS
jgi:molybdopterin/thiamine biosynthesis adenylyltransferase